VPLSKTNETARLLRGEAMDMSGWVTYWATAQVRNYTYHIEEHKL
jgi:hypothetical protein